MNTQPKHHPPSGTQMVIHGGELQPRKQTPCWKIARLKSEQAAKNWIRNTRWLVFNNGRKQRTPQDWGRVLELRTWAMGGVARRSNNASSQPQQLASNSPPTIIRRTARTRRSVRGCSIVQTSHSAIAIGTVGKASGKYTQAEQIIHSANGAVFGVCAKQGNRLSHDRIYHRNNTWGCVGVFDRKYRNRVVLGLQFAVG